MCFLRGLLRWLTEPKNPSKFAKRTARYNKFRYKLLFFDRLVLLIVRNEFPLKRIAVLESKFHFEIKDQDFLTAGDLT